MSELHPDDRKKLGQVLGMKPAEIVAAAEVDGFDPPGAVVQTHDGQRVLVWTDGDGKPVVTPWDGPMPGELVGEHGPELELDEQVGAVVDLGDVPDGSAEVVLAWVGEDKERAARALAAEQARDKPRSTLVGQLEKLAQA